MPRLVPLLLAALISLPAAVSAQQRDSVFASYEAYAAFVDRHIMQRDFIPLIQVLGGRDEYTPEQLRGVNTQLLHAFPRDFTDVAVFRETDLGNGFRQEARLLERRAVCLVLRLPAPARGRARGAAFRAQQQFGRGDGAVLIRARQIDKRAAWLPRSR